MLRLLILLVVVGLLVGVIAPTDLGEALRIAWDWTVQTIAGIAEGASR